MLPFALWRLWLLAPIGHDCFVLRIPIGLTAEICSVILRLSVRESDDMLCAVLQELHRNLRREATS
jgi:hypothetical protein